MVKRPTLMGGRAAAASRTATEDPRLGAAAADQRRSQRTTVRQWTARVTLPLALALWLVSLRHVELRGMDDYGLLQVLPVLFWITLGLLTFGFCLVLSDRRTGVGWYAGYVLGLIAVIHATPTLLYPTLRYSWAWKHVAVVDAMIRHGGEVPNAEQLSVYNHWPGFFQLNALFLKATGIESSLTYAAWAPPVFNALLLAPLLLLYRTVTYDRRLIWGGAWVYYSCSWVGQDYFAPQAFAFLLFVTLIALVLRQLPTSTLRRPDAPPTAGWPPGRLVLVVLIEIAIISSHPLTPLMLISALLALSVPRRNRRVVLPVLASAVLLTVVWDLTMARTYLWANVSDLLDALGQPAANVASGLATLGIAAPGQVVVSWVDRGLSAAVVLLAVVAFLSRPWVRRSGLPLLVLAPLPVLVANAYDGEMLFRAYLFALPAAALLIAALLFRWGGRPNLRVVTVWPLLLILLGGLVFGYYGKEAAYYFTKEEVAASRFVTATAPQGSLIVSLTSAVPGLNMYYDRHAYLEMDLLDIRDRRRLQRDPVRGLEPFIRRATPDRPAYIVLSRAQAAECYLMGYLPADTVRRLESALPKTPGFLAVYRNKDATVFRYENPKWEEGR